MKTILVTTFFLCLFYICTAQETDKATNMTTPMLGLRTTVYKVQDLTKAKEWYITAFQTQPYFDEPFYVGFNISGYELGLLPEEKPVADKTDNTISYWGVKDIHKEYKRIIELGAREHEKPTNYGEELMIASVKDPWGNVVGLIYNPHFTLKNE